ncbi:hypothetical protein ACB092_11G121100 [Castanea dentata]
MVDQSKTYLLRVVNAVVAADIFFAISQHNLTVIGMDGHYTKPITTSYITISPGQTMHLLLTANQISDFNQFNTTAILQYRGNYTIPSSPSFPKTLPLYKDVQSALKLTTRLRSLASKEHPINVPLNITTKMFITLSMNDLECRNTTCTAKEGENILAAGVNNISWFNPDIDIFSAYYRNISGVYTTDFPDNSPSFFNFTGEDLPTSIALTELGTKVKVLNYNEAVEVVFQGTNLMAGSGIHPMHLHGYSFYVIGIGLGNFDNETDPKGFNLVDPPEVNTFEVRKNGWLALRFIANNPGVWFWHCHLDRHMTWGMAGAFIVKNGDTLETSIRRPPAYLPSCRVPTRPKPQMSDGFEGIANESSFI